MDYAAQKLLFDIPADISYLNTASISPSFKAVEAAGLEAVLRKSRPYSIPPSDFFEPVLELKKSFAKIIQTAEYERIALIPSVSYGIAAVTNNIKLKPQDKVILLAQQFPSNYYSWKKLTDKFHAQLEIIAPPQSGDKGQAWNQSLLNAIDDQTAVVAMGQIHWSSGIIFDLDAISKKTKKHNGLFIIDGSQSIGALPFSVEKLQPDAVICAGYKWLFGPYGCAYAYYGPHFDQGEPLEENWTNRLGSETAHDLTDYQNKYKPFANRYMMGESGNFIYTQMQLAALDQVTKWKPESLQKHCQSISQQTVESLRLLGCHIENDKYRSHHLFGLELPQNLDVKVLKKVLRERNIYVSFRGNYIRLSCHFFNIASDFERFLECFKLALK